MTVMDNLLDKKCVPCEGGVPPLTSEEIQKYMPQLKEGWQVLEGNPPLPVRQKANGVGASKIKKEFKFKDFKETMEFVNKVADIANQEDHHPDMEVSYSKVVIILWTHAIHGLSENDFIVAAKIDAIS